MKWFKLVVCAIIVFILLHIIIAFVSWDNYLYMGDWDIFARMFFLYGWICGTILLYPFTGWAK